MTLHCSDCGGALQWYIVCHNPKKRQVALIIEVIGGFFLLMIGSFFMWDPLALYTDTFAFPVGGAETLHPIRGFTIGRFLMGAGLIPTYVTPFPFQILQLVVGIPLFL